MYQLAKTRPTTALDIAALSALKLQSRLEQDHIERLEALLREHGIPLPEEDSRLGASGAEHLEQCRAVVKAAYALVEELERLKEMIGSGHELLS